MKNSNISKKSSVKVVEKISQTKPLMKVLIKPEILETGPMTSPCFFKIIPMKNPKRFRTPLNNVVRYYR
jgi:hypothetical protein